MMGAQALLLSRVAPGSVRSMRALLLLATTVVLLIVGLLGMHSLGGSAAGHGGSAPVHVATGHVAAHPEAPAHGAHIAAGDREVSGAHAETSGAHSAEAHAANGAHPHDAHAKALAAPCTNACSTPAPPSHDHSMLMACVLALLAGLIVLARPASLTRAPHAFAAALRPAVLEAPAARAGLPPPSLVVLSISRT